MKIFWEVSLTNFEFWSGAKDRAAKLTDDELEQIESMLEELFPEGIDKTAVNDLFWFDFESVLEWIGKEECPDCGEIFEAGGICECKE